MIRACPPKPEGKPLSPPPAGPQDGLQTPGFQELPPMTPQEAEKLARLQVAEERRLERERARRER